jgi:predicted O-linked N-acetylglucosamine transferase (SPINDLY family)
MDAALPEDGANNLAVEAAAQGLGAGRLISTDLLPQDTHLTGKSAAHLYLDTFTYHLRVTIITIRTID